MLYSLCYPALSDEDNDFIQAFREQNDLPYRDVVLPHFTMAFGIDGVPQSDYMAHVEAVAKRHRKIEFTSRYAMLGDDESSSDFYIFLVPDEGFSEISLLHDDLYTGILEPYHRVEIPYVPHIGIATIPDARAIKVLCDELNSGKLLVSGMLNEITVSKYAGKKITDVESYKLPS